MPDTNSNARNTDDLASLNITVSDLGLSGAGVVQESEPLLIRLVLYAVNDGPLLDLPEYFAAREDVPLLMSGISVSDADSNESGGETASPLQATCIHTSIAVVHDVVKSGGKTNCCSKIAVRWC